LIASSEATIMRSDGIPQRRATFLVSLGWFGEVLAINAIGGATRFPLLGVHLLAERILTVDYVRDAGASGSPRR
jgi:hypothetical protein